MVFTVNVKEKKPFPDLNLQNLLMDCSSHKSGRVYFSWINVIKQVMVLILKPKVTYLTPKTNASYFICVLSKCIISVHIFLLK